IGPVLSAQLMDSWRPEALFAFTALVHGLLAAYAAFRITRRQVPDIKGIFRALPLPKTVTPESAVLDPRSGEDDEA
ncbi:MAG: MFS transporter, partial [Alphaproteobacteria bacterium]